MATLNQYTFLTLNEVKEWLKIPLLNTDYDNTVTRLINVATSMAEEYIDGPIKTRRYVETLDGNSSNVILPSEFPATSIEEIRIDYNRNFGSTTLISAEDFVLRGVPNPNNVSANFEVSVKGQDIVLRDDNNAAVLGRIFSGSVIGSIRLTYNAGYGATQDDMPAALVHAVLMLTEYLYILKENRELNIKAKNSMNQGYSRDTGIPKEVTDILDDFKDYRLGVTPTPQKNTFVL